MPKLPDARDNWARLGAIARLTEIDAERALIFATFPDLRRSTSLARPASAPASGGRQRRKISADGRKKMAEGMRRYWAERKAGQHKKAQKAQAR